jgi:FkbM family methyltransferase
MNSKTMVPDPPELQGRRSAGILSDTISSERSRLGQRIKKRIVLTGITSALQAANRFFQQGHYADAFDIYEQTVAAYPEHSVDILAALYDLYQALPDKEDRYALYQARLFDFAIATGDKVLDVGSGNVPFPLATHLVDLAPHNDHYGRAGAPFKYVQGKPVQVCDIENMDCFADKEFDFVYCSHVLEHVHSPEKACRELMRIAKRGYIETPTRGKDLWLNTGQVSNHRWSVEWFRSKLIFTEYTPEEIEGLKCDLLMSMHLEPQSKREKALTSLIYLKTDLLNTMFLWEGEFEYEVRRLPVLASPASEKDLCQAIERIVQPGWTCADFGANVGLITAILAERVGPAGKVLAFEAHPANARILRENMRSRGYASRIKVGSVAISDGVESKVWLHAGRNGSACEWNIVGHDVDGRPTPGELKVNAAKLDTFFPPGSSLDLVKIDIEGAAGSALAGMSRLLRETRPILLVEFHDDTEWGARNRLLDSGYDLCNLSGRKIDPKRDVRRLYQCLAIPSELSTRILSLFLGDSQEDAPEIRKQGEKSADLSGVLEA